MTPKERRRLASRLAVVAAALTALTLATSALSYYRPWGVGIGRYGIGVDRCGLALAKSSQELSRRGMAWRLGAEGELATGAETDWVPVRAAGRIVGPSPAGRITKATLLVLYVPLRPWAVLAGVVGAGLWWYSRRKLHADACEICSYDVRGITTGRCPECGAALMSPVRALFRWAQARAISGGPVAARISRSGADGLGTSNRAGRSCPTLWSR